MLMWHILRGEGFVAGALVAETGEKAGDGNVFVEGVPMQAAGTDPDLLALFGGAVEEAGKPRQRNADRSAVAQIDPHIVRIESYARCAN